MSAHETLLQLCQAHGIVPDYYDIWGKRHEVSEPNLVALLAAMGVRATSAEEVALALREAQRARWQAVLPPVAVLREDEARWPLRLNLRAATDASRMSWRLVEEGGAQDERAFDARDAREIESAEIDGERYIAREVEIPLRVCCGYHRLALLHNGAPAGETALIVVPPRSFRPQAVQGEGRIWGAALQLYALRSERNWGMGDFTDLATVLEQWGARGADIIGLNPLHALFPHNPQHASPYSPSSRCFFNVLYIDVEAVADFRESAAARSRFREAEFQSRLDALRALDIVDYAGVAAAKMPMLELCYAHFCEHHLGRGSARARTFDAFREARAPALTRHALFEALQEYFFAQDARIWGWPAWPEAYRDPGAPAVAAFAEAHAERVRFFEYLQWLVAIQMDAVGRRSMQLGLGAGLYQDLAVSVDRGGAESWSNQGLYAVAASVGAPPDDFNLRGQDWGLPPFVPGRLRASAYAPFVDMLRANMRDAGALRIDHVMALARLFWIPQGGEPRDGGYVRYPFEDLVGIVALESHRNRCMVIGEDLGTVPDEVRATLARVGILSYRILFFEREHSGEFKAPADYVQDAVVTAATHDLPTLAGYWEGRDLRLREELGLFPSEESRQQQANARNQDRARLLLALERAGLLPAGASNDPASLPETTPALLCSMQRYLARSRARILVVQPEDVLGVREQVNLPGTTHEHPNWKRKLPLALELWGEDARFQAMAHALAAERPLARPRPLQPAPGAARIPRATYRLQLHRGFTFADASALVPYLHRLGISHVYCSPYLRARPGSTHGYDIVDHNMISPELGGAPGFAGFCEALQRHGMGQILDLVPNHMGVMGADNDWWLDVLENGPASIYGAYFDIDWYPVNPELANRVLVPVLGDHYGNVLEAGELRLAFEAAHGTFSVHYHGHRFPLDPREYPRVLERALRLLEHARADAVLLAESASLCAAFAHLPARSEAGAEKLAERNRDKEVHKRRLAQLVREHAPFAEAIACAVQGFNPATGRSADFDALDALLEAQAYRLAFWRVAADEINYRRFFDINDLAALRMETEAVFHAAHGYVFELLAAGKVDGLRIDHADGLYDPAQYFRRLQEHYARIVGLPAAEATGGRPARPLYVVAEKIAARHEHVPTSWAVHGTTGYRFATVVNALFVERQARTRLDRAWRAFTGETANFDEAAYRGKSEITRSALASELTVLATDLLRIARADRHTRDYTFNTLRRAVAEVASCFPVYRTYVAGGLRAQDRRYIDWAVAQARKRSRSADATVFDFLRRVLLVEAPAGAAPALQRSYRNFTMKFQQFTAPVSAKGVEDTAFYVFNRLSSLNEVGGDPDMFGMSLAAFHGASADRAARWPHTMLATSTHDNKRAEDVRCRIDVLSETVAAWRLALRRWGRMNAAHKRMLDSGAAPSRNDEYLLYQTLLGTLPSAPLDSDALQSYRERIEAYMLKVVREAKVHTSWVNINADYEAAVSAFVCALLGRADANPFLEDLYRQARPLAWFGMLNSLSMLLIKLTSPGVPDFYQGSELLELNLVDPDNRRPVDYALRREMLARLEAVSRAPAETLAHAVHALFDEPRADLAKLWLMWRGLQYRCEREQLFRDGDYRAIAVSGTRARHVIAYTRRFGAQGIAVIAGRFFASMRIEPGVLPCGEETWLDTEVDLGFLDAHARVHDVITGQVLETDAHGRLRLARACSHFPGALLAFPAGDAAPRPD